MAIDWNDVAIALACRIEYERACGRGQLLTEDVTRMMLVEVVQSKVTGTLEIEHNHADLPGDTRVDILVRSPRAANIEAAIEHKWVRSTTANTGRNWMTEIVRDLLRLECLSTSMAQGSERTLVIVGEVDELQAKFWDRTVNAAGARLRVVPGLLQDKAVGAGAVGPQPATITVDLRGTGGPFKALLRTSELYGVLPSHYGIRLVGHYMTRPTGIECAVWQITRPVQRRVPFDGRARWP